MWGGSAFKAAWQGATEAAKKSAAALALGTEVLSVAVALGVTVAKSKAVDARQWIADETVAAARWLAQKGVQAVDAAKRSAAVAKEALMAAGETFVAGVKSASSQVWCKTTEVYNDARANAQAENRKSDREFEEALALKKLPEIEAGAGAKSGPRVKKSAGSMKGDKLVEEGDVSVEASIGVSRTRDFLRFGGDDNNLAVGHAEGEAAVGYKFDPAKNQHSFSLFDLSGKVSAVTASSDVKTAKGLVEQKINVDAGSLSGELTPISIVVGPSTAKVEGSAGAEAVAIKGSVSEQVNITPKTIYDNTIGRIVGAVNPESDYVEAVDWLDHGLVVGGQGELGYGAAAEAEYMIGVEEGLFKVGAGAKLGAGPMAGLKVFVGVK